MECFIDILTLLYQGGLYGDVTYFFFVRRLSIVLLRTTQKSRYMYMTVVSIITLTSKVFVPECDEIYYAIAVNVWAEPL